MRLTLGTNYDDPLFRPLAGGLIFSSSDLARSAIQQGADVVRYVYDTFGSPGSSAEAMEVQPAALLAIDFPTGEDGWPCTHERPRINVVLVAPISLREAFESALDFESLVSRFNVGPTPLCGLELQEIDSSEAGIRLAVDHLQKFIRTLAGATFPGEVSPVFAVSAPPMTCA